MLVVTSLAIDGTIINAIFFFFNDTATTEIYTLSLHDALPISFHHEGGDAKVVLEPGGIRERVAKTARAPINAHRQDDKRSEEHTSELQSQSNLVCRLLLEKKKEHRGSGRVDQLRHDEFELLML